MASQSRLFRLALLAVGLLATSCLAKASLSSASLFDDAPPTAYDAPRGGPSSPAQAPRDGMPSFSGPAALAGLFDGVEYRWKNMVFRPAEFLNELFIAAFVLFYVLWYFVGSAINKSKAYAWTRVHLPIFESNFAQTLKENGKPLLFDGADQAVLYSSGRRGAESMHVLFDLLPRQDFIKHIGQTTWKMSQFEELNDLVTIDIRLRPSRTPSADTGVFGVVSKSTMSSLRKARYDLSFTRTSDSPYLPNPTLSVMSETNDVLEAFLNSKVSKDIGLAPLLAPESVAAKWFEWLIITDQPSKRPSEGPIPQAEKERHILLTIRLPPRSRSSETIPLVEMVLNLVDVLERGMPFKTDTVNKLKKIRKEVGETLQKEYEKDKNEEAEEKKRAEKRKAEEERIAKLSPSEQRKHEEKERKRGLRKAQGKVKMSR